MRAYRGLKKIVAPLVVLAVVGVGSADVQFGGNGGISWPIDEGADNFNMGWGAGIHGFLVATPNLLLGARIGYNRWGIDKAEILASNLSIQGGDIDGSTHIIELMPAVRLRSHMEDWLVNVFGQAGVGVYIRSVNGNIEGTNEDGAPVRLELFDSTTGRVGLQAGGGISLGAIDRFGIEIYPLYNWIFSDKELSQYFTLNLGVSVQLR